MATHQGASTPTCSVNSLGIFQWSDHTSHNQLILKLFLISSCSTTTDFFVPELMDLLAGEDLSQADQPKNLAEGHPHVI
jgi:hypothetical protein